MNVWVNPAYWRVAFLDKQVAAEVSGLVALVCYAFACYAMVRCFDLPRVPSIAAAQLGLMLFGLAALALGFAVVYVSIPGLAVVYAPHMLAFGLLARLSPEPPQVFLIGATLFALLFYSLYCDPLWTLVSGIAWMVPFAMVTFSRLRRGTIAVRCAALGGSLALLLLSGALKYTYSLSQYTARAQFPDLLRRPRMRYSRRLSGADLLLTGMIFSGTVDGDISFDYGIFAPGCRRADLADIKQLHIKLPNP